MMPPFLPLYDDNHLLVACKPAGIATQPHAGDREDFLTHAKEWIKVHYHKRGNVFLEPIHRLDKPVSGIVLFARTSKALSRLQALMRDKQCTKIYCALVEGELPFEENTLEHFLVHAEHRALVVSAAHPEAKQARLSYRVLASRQGKSLVEIALETGRYHQIRAQFSAIGYPIVGDRKYGSRLPWQQGAIALHHTKMSLKHPVTAQELAWTSDSNFGGAMTVRI